MKNHEIIKNLQELENMINGMIAHFEGVLDGDISDPALDELSFESIESDIRELYKACDEVSDLCVGLITGNYEDHERARALELIEFWGIE